MFTNRGSEGDTRYLSLIQERDSGVISYNSRKGDWWRTLCCWLCGRDIDGSWRGEGEEEGGVVWSHLQSGLSHSTLKQERGTISPDISFIFHVKLWWERIVVTSNCPWTCDPHFSRFILDLDILHPDMTSYTVFQWWDPDIWNREKKSPSTISCPADIWYCFWTDSAKITRAWALNFLLCTLIFNNLYTSYILTGPYIYMYGSRIDNKPLLKFPMLFILHGIPFLHCILFGAKKALAAQKSFL